MTYSQKQLFVFSTALSLAIVTLQFFSPAPLHSLSFWPEKLKLFEVWRLLSAHIIHFNFFHSAINLIAFWAILLVFYWNLPLKTLIVFLILCCLGVDAGLFLLGATNQEYIGFSGALHGLAIAGACNSRQHKLWRRAAFILIILFKVIAENFFITNSGGITNQQDFIVAADAHAYGAISGLMIGLFCVTNKKRFGK
jgi:rhomboid family GlyGly-CTERM serine protease